MGIHERRKPLEEVGYVPLSSVTGLKSRARSRAAFKREVDWRTNRAICVLRQMWKGRLNDDLLVDDPDSVRPEPTTQRGTGVLTYLREVIGGAMNRRPLDSPVGAAALRRQRGAADMRPQVKKETLSPNRGDIWPGNVPTVALPSGQDPLVPISAVSPSAARYLNRFEELMLHPEPERLKLCKELEETGEKTYVDPELKSQIYALALRLAKSRMLRPVRTTKSSV